ncbi:MAG: PrsW family intramembrane metalloprotease [Anaerolineae bacterium]|nr:PrsW family intramembrane metalloprotease [Anaerolineae bacterium]
MTALLANVLAYVLAYAIALIIPAFAFYLIHTLDLFKTSKTRTLVICGLWGALGAYPLAVIVNNGLRAALGDAAVASLTAPVVEEVLKALVLVYCMRRASFYYFVDGAVYGFGVGVGFAMIENFAYVSGTPSVSLAVVRVLSTSLMHAMASGVVGISLGRLRRTRRTVMPLLGIVAAVAIHVAYNHVVNTLTGLPLALVAITIGVGGAALIGLQILYGLRHEKAQFTRTLGIHNDVSAGERQAIQRLGGTSIETILRGLGATFGEDNVALIRRLLITEANIGILQNNLSSSTVSPRLRDAWEAEIAQRQAESRDLRAVLGRSVLAYLSSVFPAHDRDMWEYLQGQFARDDPTMVHTFDMFMRMTGLAQKFTPEQLQARAERLSRIDIFRHVSLADLENLSRAVEVAQYADGTLLFDKGDDGDAMYLIEAGGIDVLALDHAGQEKHLRTYGAGEVVGDFAVLDGEPRSARARANGALSVLVLRRAVFRMFIQSRPQVMLVVLTVLAERARYTTRAVERALQTLSSIVQGEYTAPLVTPVVMPPPAHTEPPLTEIPADVPSLLERALARMAALVQAHDGAAES